MTNYESEGKVSEILLEKYVYLNRVAKEAKDEMDKIKRVFHLYFDETVGTNQKGEISIGGYIIQRQVRVSESFDDERTVSHLEQLNLADCIDYIKKPDVAKIEAAIQLGLLNSDEINQYKISKLTQAISVKRVK